MFVRLWDSTDPRVGDIRPFPQRLQDSIDNELGRGAPAILLVPTTWQTADGSFIPFENTLDMIQRFSSFGDSRIVPFIKWNAQAGWDVTTPSYRGITTRDVAQGKLDDYIHEYARAVRAYGGPLFISPVCAEFNGNWWRSCSPGADPTLSATDFVLAWRRTVDIFRGEGATNVAWVWNPVQAPAVQDFTPYYPGDGYVDWAGIDMYDSEPPASIEASYQFAAAHGKPFFLGEWGVRHPMSALTPAQQRDWIDAMFDLFESHLRIKAVVYYNYNQAADTADASHMTDHVFLYGGTVNYLPNVNDGDSRLVADSGAGFRAAFARRLASRRYLFQVQGVPTPTPAAPPS